MNDSWDYLNWHDAPKPSEEELKEVATTLELLFQTHPRAVVAWIYSTWPRCIGLYD